MVYGLVSGANRDPRVYDSPDEFIVERKANNHLGFAGGPHRCLGRAPGPHGHAGRCGGVAEGHPRLRGGDRDPLMERGGGAMMTLLSLPLTWEVPA